MGAPPAPHLRVCLEGWTGGRAAHACPTVCVAPGGTQRPGLLCPDVVWRVAAVPLCTFHKAVVARQRVAGGGEVSSINSMIAHTHPCAHTLIHTYTHVRTHTHSYTYTRTHTRTHTHTCIYTRTHMRTHTHANAHTHLYIHTHTHAYTHTYSHMHTRARTHTRGIYRKTGQCPQTLQSPRGLLAHRLD